MRVGQNAGTPSSQAPPLDHRAVEARARGVCPLDPLRSLDRQGEIEEEVEDPVQSGTGGRVPTAPEAIEEPIPTHRDAGFREEVADVLHGSEVHVDLGCGTAQHRERILLIRI